MGDIGYLTVLIHLFGEGFNPDNLKGKYNYRLEIIYKPGDILKNGKNRGKVSTAGFCFYEFNNSMEHKLLIPNAIDLVNSLKEDNISNKLNIEDIELSLLFTGCQGNMELSSQELRLLSSLDSGIAMTYVGATNFDYSKQRRLRRLKSKYLIKE